MKRMTGLTAIAVLMLTSCGGPDERAGETQGPLASACGPAPSALAEPPELPPGFPTPEGVVYTEGEEAGPSMIVRGYFDGDFAGALETYKDAFTAAGYDITDEETEADEGEVNFAGGGTDGQVKAEEACEGRAELRITIRPAD